MDRFFLSHHIISISPNTDFMLRPTAKPFLSENNKKDEKRNKTNSKSRTHISIPQPEK
jgi:hypothetical protein